MPTQGGSGGARTSKERDERSKQLADGQKKADKGGKKPNKSSGSKEEVRANSPKRSRIVISFGIEIETVLLPKFSEIAAILCPGKDVQQYLREKYAFDESYDATKLDSKTATRWKDRNKRAMRNIVRDLLWADSQVESYADPNIAREEEKAELDYSILNIVDDDTIRERRVTHYGMELILGIFNSEALHEAQRFCQKVFATVQKCFEIISNETCGTHIHARPCYEFFTPKQLSNCAKWVTVYEEASYHHLPKSRQRDTTNEARPNTEIGSQEIARWMNKSREKNDFNHYIFKHIDTMIDDSEAIVNFVSSSHTTAYNFRPTIEHMKATLEYRQPPQVLSIGECLHWVAEKVASLHDMLTRDFEKTLYTREATPEEYGTMIRRAARELGVEQWLMYFRRHEKSPELPVPGKSSTSAPAPSSSNATARREHKHREEKTRKREGSTDRNKRRRRSPGPAS